MLRTTAVTLTTAARAASATAVRAMAASAITFPIPTPPKYVVAPALDPAFKNDEFDTPAPAMVPGTLHEKAGAPGVVLLHECWGINGSITAAANKLNELGYRVLVPDLYRGKASNDWEQAAELMTNLKYVDAVDDINAAVTYLKDTGSSKVAVMGFCMGGGLSMAATGLSPQLVDAGIVFYGKAPDALKITPELLAGGRPLQFHMADQGTIDDMSDYATADDLEEGLVAAGVNHEFHRYANEAQWFMNEDAEMKAVLKELEVPTASETSQQTAWGRVDSFLKANLV